MTVSFHEFSTGHTLCLEFDDDLCPVSANPEINLLQSFICHRLSNSVAPIRAAEHQESATPGAHYLTSQRASAHTHLIPPVNLNARDGRGYRPLGHPVLGLQSAKLPNIPTKQGRPYLQSDVFYHMKRLYPLSILPHDRLLFARQYRSGGALYSGIEEQEALLQLSERILRNDEWRNLHLS